MKKILVADDDIAILEASQLLLEDAGYTVEITTNGETVQHMEKDLPDLLLLDIWMSGIDGGEICRHLKSQEKTKKLPIIIFSANRDTKRIAEETGADDFIEKPFAMEELLEKVDKLLK